MIVASNFLLPRIARRRRLSDLIDLGEEVNGMAANSLAERSRAARYDEHGRSKDNADLDMYCSAEHSPSRIRIRRNQD